MRSFSCFAVLLLTVVDRVFRLYRVSRWIHGSNDCSNAKSYCSTRFSVSQRQHDTQCIAAQSTSLHMSEICYMREVGRCRDPEKK